MDIPIFLTLSSADRKLGSFSPLQFFLSGGPRSGIRLKCVSASCKEKIGSGEDYGKWEIMCLSGRGSPYSAIAWGPLRPGVIRSSDCSREARIWIFIWNFPDFLNVGQLKQILCGRERIQFWLRLNAKGGPRVMQRHISSFGACEELAGVWAPLATSALSFGNAKRLPLEERRPQV